MIPPVAPGQSDDKQNMVSWKNTFSMRQISLMNMAASQFSIKNGNKMGISSSRRAYNMTGPVNSLDLLRKTLQSAINKDIDNILKKYLEKYFQPAINNIRNNLGGECINDDQIQELCKQMLEDAKTMYKIAPVSRDSSPYEFSDSEASTSDSRFERMSPFDRKRKESDTDSETTSKRHKSQYLTEYSKYKLPLRREGPKWNPDRISENTLFIMGPRANKVLGYAQTRGRLYARHPDLVRYSGDQEDKEWLAGKNLMPPSGGKAYLMVFEDIKELTENEDYRNNPNLQLNELKGFLIPPFMLNKVKIFIQNSSTERKPFFGLDLFDFHSDSTTPTNTNLDSGPSTPSDTIHLESQPGSTSSKQSDNFVNIPEMSPNSNQSIISSQSPIQNSGLLSPNILMTMASNSDGSNSVMVLKDNSQNDSCLSSILTSHFSSDNSQDF